MKKEESLKRYFAEAKSWELDKARSRKRAMFVAWAIAVAAIALAMLSSLAVSRLTPLKSVEPFIVRVNEVTGYVDIVTELKDGETNYSEVMNKYFLTWYLRYREEFSMALIKEYYYNVGLMSSTAEQERYYRLITPRNPKSFINRLNYGKIRTIKIKSFSFIEPQLALVRYMSTEENTEGNRSVSKKHWAATIKFSYSAALTSERDRRVNPLGFIVSEYRNDLDGVEIERNKVVTDEESVREKEEALIEQRIDNIRKYENELKERLEKGSSSQEDVLPEDLKPKELEGE